MFIDYSSPAGSVRNYADPQPRNKPIITGVAPKGNVSWKDRFRSGLSTAYSVAKSFVPGAETIDALGNLAGTALTAYGQHSANTTNIDLAREQMAFQREMSSTQLQRAVKDAELANLNPYYALGVGGAASPSGASTHVSNPFAGAVSNAVEIRRANAEVKNLREQNKYIRSQTLLNKAQTRLSNATTVARSTDTAKDLVELGGMLGIQLAKKLGRRGR